MARHMRFDVTELIHHHFLIVNWFAFEKNIPTSWIEMTLMRDECQVHRMTATIGFPTLRLVRFAIGDYQLGDLSSGEYRVIEATRVPSAHGKQRHPSHRRHVRRR